MVLSLDEDHPRIRGTNRKRIESLCKDIGSSPHTRDKFFGNLLIRYSPRIIPAYAGQISTVDGVVFGRKDHPRIRGTNMNKRVVF